MTAACSCWDNYDPELCPVHDIPVGICPNCYGAYHPPTGECPVEMGLMRPVVQAAPKLTVGMVARTANQIFDILRWTKAHPEKLAALFTISGVFEIKFVPNPPKGTGRLHSDPASPVSQNETK